MAYFPFMVDIEHKDCLVVGGGKIALHKVRILYGFGVHIHVVAEDICPEMEAFAGSNAELELIKRQFRDGDIAGMDMVVAATDDEALNRHISDLCMQRKIPINAVDMKDACSFIFPAMIQDRDLLIAVSTGGQSPAAAAYVKQKLKAQLPDYYGDMIAALGGYRDIVLQNVDTADKRKEVFLRLLEYGDMHGGQLPKEKVYQVMDEEKSRTVRIGTRGSALALAQTERVIAALRKQYPELSIETVILHTKGDKILDRPLLDFGGKGVFIAELEEALMQGRIDLAVHSSKDMPMEISKGLVIAGALPRADARDVLVTRRSVQQEHMTIGTGSLRRQIQLKELYPNIRCVGVRGNVPTRLQKVRDGVFDGVVLAAAGLERLGLLEEPDFDYRLFSFDEMVPAGGQGIIAVQGREGDRFSRMAAGISDKNAALELETERNILRLLDAGCHEAVGAFSEVRDGKIDIRIVWEKEGRIYRKQGRTEPENRQLLINRMLGESGKS